MKDIFEITGLYLIEVVLFEKHFYTLFSYYEEESIYNTKTCNKTYENIL